MPTTPLEGQPLLAEDDPVSTVDTLLQPCPRFRILVLGRSGVGKSSLINAVFRTQQTVVQHGRTPGVSDIEQEITSEQNPHLILHDSQGFSHGDAGNFKIVKKFIERRSRSTLDLKDRLHAIWLCTEVPTFGGSLLEVSEEKILQLKHRGPDTPVPIITVLTKYDKLVRSLMPQSDQMAAHNALYGDIDEESDNQDDNINSDMASSIEPKESHVDMTLLSTAEIKLQNEIIKDCAGNLDPWVPVSVNPNFHDTLDRLVKMTEDLVDEGVRIVLGIAQQQSVDSKIDKTIEIGKRKYWHGLATALELPGKSLENWLKVVHRDIVKVWGLHDPDDVLSYRTMRMSELQEVEEGGAAWSIPLASVLPGAAAIVSAVLPPAAPFAVPIAAGIVIAAWVGKAVKITPNILRGMMGYIVNLTLVMHSLFLLMQARMDVFPSPVTQRLLDLALRAYKQVELHKVQEEIALFVTLTRAYFGHEEVIKEVERLIRDHRSNPSESFMAKARSNTISLV